MKLKFKNLAMWLTLPFVTYGQSAPSLTQQPSSVAVMAGAGATLSVSASGNLPLWYQWYRGFTGDTSVPMLGSTDVNFSVPSSSNVERYWVRITNSSGTADSRSAVVIPWVTRNAGFSESHYLAGVSYVNQRYIVTGNEISAFSADGVTWTQGHGAGSLTGGQVAYGNGKYVVGKGSTTNNVYSSTDALTWSYSRPNINGIVSRVLFTGTRFVAVGKEPSNAALISSDDGGTWTVRSTPSTIWDMDIAQGDNLLVAVGSPMVDTMSVATSTDGLTWNSQPSVSSKRVLAITHGRGKFVVLAISSEGVDSLVSADGVNWNSTHVPNTADGFFHGLTSGSGFFAASFDRSLWISEDGVNWSITTNFFPISTFGGAIGYGPFGLLWVTDNNTIMQSAPLPASVSVVIDAGSRAPVLLTGQSATLSVTGSGMGLSYQWYRGTSGNTTDPISGATSASYQTPALTQTSSYWVRVSQGADFADSATMTVTVAVQPAITTQPQDADLFAGQTVNLSVAATGTPLPSYQWYEGDSGDTSHPLVGKTSATFVATALERVARYWVRATNVAGNRDSRTAIVTPWHAREPARVFAQVIVVNKQLVAVSGDDVRTSADGGATWTIQVPVGNPFFNAEISGIAFNAGVYVVVGRRGVFSSTDLQTWTKRQMPRLSLSDDTNAFSVAFTAGKFWVSAGASIYYSADGSSWARSETGLTRFFVRAIASNGSRLVAAGTDMAADGTAVGGILASADGITWSKRNLGLDPNNYKASDFGTELVTVTFAGGRFVGVASSGNIFSSVDGLTWVRIHLSSPFELHFKSIAYGAGIFVAGQELTSDYATSTDGVNWIGRVGKPRLGSGWVVHDGTQFLAGRYSDYVHSSSDGMNWTEISGAPADVESVTYGNGVYAVSGDYVAYGRQVYSVDGVDWHTAVTPSAGPLGFANGLFISSDVQNVGRIYTSSDASNWVQRTVAGATESYYRFTFGNGVYVLLGHTSVATSSDGVTWTAHAIGVGSPNFNGLAFGQGVFVAVGDLGQIATSTNGESWTIRRSENAFPFTFLQDIAFGAGKFVAVGEAVPLVSTDGVTWPAPNPSIATGGLTTIAFGEGKFCAFNASAGSIVISEDGLNWRATAVTFSAANGVGKTLAYGPFGFYGPRIQSVSPTAPFVAPGVITSPQNQTIEDGATAIFSVRASGSAPLKYQWQVLRRNDTIWQDTGDGLSYTGSQTATIVAINNRSVGNNGDQYRCVVSNTAGTVTSSAALLTVAVSTNTSPIITTQPQNQTVPNGGNANLTVVAAGTGPLTYQWQYSAPGDAGWTDVANTSPYGGADTATLTITGATSGLNHLAYRCLVSNTAGVGYSGSAVLTVN